MFIFSYLSHVNSAFTQPSTYGPNTTDTIHKKQLVIVPNINMSLTLSHLLLLIWNILLVMSFFSINVSMFKHVRICTILHTLTILLVKFHALIYYFLQVQCHYVHVSMYALEGSKKVPPLFFLPFNFACLWHF